MPPDDDDDLPDTPKCLFCGQRRDGRRYRLWGAMLISTTKKRSFFSGETTVTSSYSRMKRVSYYACRPCAKWAIRWEVMPNVGIFVAIALACLAGSLMMPDDEQDLKFTTLGFALIAVVPAVGFLADWLLRNTDSTTNDQYVRDCATRRLKAKGKGDTFFTEAEYDHTFSKKSPSDPTPARHETAAELLDEDDDGGDEDDDDRPTRRRRN